jgi:hypothetical protein
MDIKEFVSGFRNHPILFIGTGISLRYFQDSYTWDSLLRHVAYELHENEEYYLDVKSNSEVDGKYDYTKIASELEKDFNSYLQINRNGKFKEVNDIFYKLMEEGVNCSRFKIYVSKLLGDSDINPEMKDEIAELKKIRKNIASIITTNYDQFIEKHFEFSPLIGNDILLSNPYGSVYKIHGCISDPLRIIITESDYVRFNSKFELIRAQLLSMFIHNPIVFLGYGIGDGNIKSILKTIFTYVEPNSAEADKIRRNFLLVEYESGSNSLEVLEHDIDLEGYSTIRINKIKTDNFKGIYTALSELILPVSAMDVRKVQNIVKEISSGGDIKVSITEDLDSIKNSDKIIAIGSSRTIQYQYQTASEMMANYFKIIDESNSQLLELINKHSIQSAQYFPVFGFSEICKNIDRIEALKAQQERKVEVALEAVPETCKSVHSSINDVFEDVNITGSNKINAVLWLVYTGEISLDETEIFLRGFENKSDTSYRKLLCVYDLKKYAD